MIKRVLILVFTLLYLAGELRAEDRISVSAGIGASYAGLGANIALQNEREFKFVALGCVALYTRSSGSNGAACGVGVGWLRTDLFSSEPSKHGLGIYAGPVENRRTNRDDYRTVYGLGLSYVYFFSGAGNRGFQIGATPALGRENGATTGYLLLNLGYQF